MALLIIGALWVYLRAVLVRHFAFHTYYFDLGIIHQVASNTSRGLFFEFTDPNVPVQGFRLGYHFDFIILLLAPLYYLWNSAAVLLTVQSTVLVSGAIPVFLLARRVLKRNVFAFIFAFMYLNHFTVHYTSIASFHSVTLATGFLLWAFWFAYINNWKVAWIWIVLGWMSKENVPLVTGMMGLYFAFFGSTSSQKRNGKILAGLSFIWFVLLLAVIMPAVGPDWVKKSSLFTFDIATNMQRIFRIETLRYVIRATTPLGLLSLLSPETLAIAAPQFAIVFLSNKETMRSLAFHYTSLINPFIVIAAIFGFKRIIAKSRSNITPLVIIGVVLLANVISARQMSPFLYGLPEIPQNTLSEVNEWQDKLSDPNISVSTTAKLGPHFAGRKYFHHFLFDTAYSQAGITDEEILERADGYENAEYVLLYKDEVVNHPSPLVRYYYNHLVENEEYERVSDENGIEVHRRIDQN